MKSEFNFDVRGYELDSFGHVNNSVYLSYFEQARWEFFKDNGFYDYFKEYGLFPVVTEVKIRYLKELKVFDKAVVKNEFKYRGNFIIAYQNVYLASSNIKIAKGTVEMVLVSVDRICVDIPDIMKHKLQEVL